MPLTIPDTVLESASLSEDEARIEIACRLFDVGRLTIGSAVMWTGLTRSEFEDALLERGIPIYRPTVEDLQHDLETLRRARAAP
jgi:predicted HTH domain antitoxin